jgi:hypothetical protein
VVDVYEEVFFFRLSALFVEVTAPHSKVYTPYYLDYSVSWYYRLSVLRSRS